MANFKVFAILFVLISISRQSKCDFWKIFDFESLIDYLEDDSSSDSSSKSNSESEAESISDESTGNVPIISSPTDLNETFVKEVLELAHKYNLGDALRKPLNEKPSKETTEILASNASTIHHSSNLPSKESESDEKPHHSKSHTTTESSSSSSESESQEIKKKDKSEEATTKSNSVETSAASSTQNSKETSPNSNESTTPATN